VQQEIAVWVDGLVATAGRTVMAPPLIRVPGGAVTMVSTWQVAQPTFANSAAPVWTSASIGPRGGALVERMKLANALTSSPSSSGSGTGS